ncbi:nucleotide sugar dehydrogenase [Streptomyces sp. GD-15H]|uniref:UDP-glucose dehydrogenase family protein n=1 Tax=Streptomyces sp. GD-15H TaxID=3129112 RepID=UPI00324C6861
MRIAVVGQGYVGLTGAVALALQGHYVTGIEQESGRLARLLAGEAPVYEPGLPEQLAAALATGRLRFAAELEPLHRQWPFEVVLIAVGTPPSADGTADLLQVQVALEEVAGLLPQPCTVLKSTVPPGTSQTLLTARPGLRGRYAYNPEFLNQGSALDDWQTPARVVAGTTSPACLAVLREMYAGVACPWIVTTPTSAEMIKYASNAFLATKISFANELARLCTLPDLDIDTVIQGVGSDPRIGHALLQPGLGFGDSCLPKDTAALAHWAAAHGIHTPLLNATIDINAAQPQTAVTVLAQGLGRDLAGCEIAVLGVRYEPWSDDLRAAPSRTIVPSLLREGARVRVWDPGTSPDELMRLFPAAVPQGNLPDAVRGAHGALVLTEWPQVIEADWVGLAELLAPPRVVVDGKNCLPAHRMRSPFLAYRSIGNRLPSADPVPTEGTNPLPGP